MPEFVNLLDPELYVLAVALYCLAEVFKKTSVDNKFIPLILVGLGIVLSGIWYVSASKGALNIAAFIFYSFNQGILAAAFTVLGNQLYQQLIKKKDQ